MIQKIIIGIMILVVIIFIIMMVILTVNKNNSNDLTVIDEFKNTQEIENNNLVDNSEVISKDKINNTQVSKTEINSDVIAEQSQMKVGSNRINDISKEVIIEKIIDEKDLAIDFELKDVNGKIIKLSDYRGKKPVIVEFWNSWCHNCVREMPQLQKIYNENNDAFEIIGVNLLHNKDTEAKVNNFIQQHQISFPIVFDEDGKVSKDYKIRATNTHFLINTDGTIFDSFFIDIEEEKLQEFLKHNGL